MASLGRIVYEGEVMAGARFIGQSVAPVMPLGEPHPTSRFNYKDRPCRDVGFLVRRSPPLCLNLGGFSPAIASNESKVREGQQPCVYGRTLTSRHSHNHNHSHSKGSGSSSGRRRFTGGITPPAPTMAVRAEDGSHSHDGDEPEDLDRKSIDDPAVADELAREFARLINEKQTSRPFEVRPSALLPPTAVVEALVRPPVTAARSWEAAERWLRLEEFSAVLHQPPYSAIIGCCHWEVASPLQFHGPGDKRAVQAVKITSSSRAESGTGKGEGEGEGMVREEERTFVYTFCLEKVEAGAYRGCWMVVGARVGDYANV
ncbi:hypothetical protein CBR_g10792 [Chara braunii]|uniref:Uncharacterized protein n=1 Tax=Chara braunii TaxID=69332 RepID=A0A388KP76_CHABU|nr:hypothetical protein CBR_g10792 [Chara braunii]|eukprot:GBG71854.1 hypothetical protein CBR_g10792 [Chara braunii]